MPGFLSVRAYDFATPGTPPVDGDNVIRHYQFWFYYGAGPEFLDASIPGAVKPPGALSGYWYYGPSPYFADNPLSAAAWAAGEWWDVTYAQLVGYPTPPPWEKGLYVG